MTQPETSDCTAEAAPTPTLAHFLNAVCEHEPYRQARGDSLIEVRVGVWLVLVPLSEIYGSRDVLGMRR